MVYEYKAKVKRMSFGLQTKILLCNAYFNPLFTESRCYAVNNLVCSFGR